MSSASIICDFALVERVAPGDQVGQFDIACPCAPRHCRRRILSIWKSTPTYARWKCTCGRHGHCTPETASASWSINSIGNKRGAGREAAIFLEQRGGAWRVHLGRVEIGSVINRDVGRAVIERARRAPA